MAYWAATLQSRKTHSTRTVVLTSAILLFFLLLFLIAIGVSSLYFKQQGIFTAGQPHPTVVATATYRLATPTPISTATPTPIPTPTHIAGLIYQTDWSKWSVSQ